MPNQNEILSSLYKEFKKLEKGKTIQVKIKSNVEFDLPVTLFWEESDYAQFKWDDKIYQKYKNYLYNEIEESCINETSKYSIEINKFIDKCNDFATQFGEDKHDFFNNAITFGRGKANAALEKKLAKNKIIETKNRIKVLNELLVDLESKIK